MAEKTMVPSAERMTRKDVLARIKELVGEEEVEVHEFCDKMIAALEKPRPKRVKPEMEEFREDVYAFVEEAGVPVTNADVTAAFETSPQRTAAALKALVMAGDLYRDDTVKPAVFGVAAAE